MQYINTSAYLFVTLAESELLLLRKQLKEKADECQLKGTILLSTEGINSFLSGTRESIDEYQSFLATFSHFKGLEHKESLSDYQPFSRMLVRLKKEIISMGCPEIQPEKQRADYLSPETLKAWYEEKKEMIVLDARNDYEIELGTFEDAIDLNIETFRDFPNAIGLLPEEMKKKPVVTFCTGGVRCEKAGQLLLNQGFEEVYQLDGGILKYLEQCGGDHWQGECFVFDKRVALNAQLQETGTTQCYDCRSVLRLDQQSGACPHCGSQASVN